MQNVLTLIAGPTDPILDDALADVVRDRLRTMGALVSEPDWLAPRLACDLAFDGPSLGEAADGARQVIGRLPVDVVVQSSWRRRKSLLVADMESTIIENEMVDELGDIAGVGPEIAEITRRAMNGEIEFRPALRQRVALLKDLRASALDEAVGRIRLVPGARRLLATMNAGGGHCALVSGGFETFCAWLCAEIGFDCYYANALLVEDGRLTGEVVEPILGKDAKLEALRVFADDNYKGLGDAIAVGDGANDVPMLQAAGTGVAFRAKPSVAAAAPHRVDHGDLTALLYIQGYRQNETVVSSERRRQKGRSKNRAPSLATDLQNPPPGLRQ